MSDETPMGDQLWRCNLCGNLHCPGPPQPDPAPSGLTAAQEIRLALTLKAMELAEKSTHPDVEADDEDIANFVRVVTGVVVPIAVMVEHGPDDPIDQSPIAAWRHDCGQAFSSYGPHPDTCFACHQPGAWTVLGPQCCPRCHTPWLEHDTDVLKRCDAMGDETPQIREWAQRCPDPVIHDGNENGVIVSVNAWNAAQAAACPDPAIHDETVLQAERDELAEARRERCPDPALHDEDDGCVLVLAAKWDAAQAAVCPDPTDHGETDELADVKAALVTQTGRMHRAYERVAELERQVEARDAQVLPLVRQVEDLNRERRTLIAERDALAAQVINAPAQVVLLERQVEELQRQRAAEWAMETKADILFADGYHGYWSTHCRHATGEEGHNACRATSFPGGGERRPSRCKVCAAKCVCECHAEHGDEGRGE